MIHSGAIIGAGLPQFRSLFFRCVKFPYSFFRSDRFVLWKQIHACRDKRDFQVCV
jgi:hypothetical protein